jgi:hypothetical protein
VHDVDVDCRSWLRLERATACRKRLLAAGYAPLPVNGKEPPLKGWQDIAATNKIIETWETKYPDAASTGILTAAVPIRCRNSASPPNKSPQRELRRFLPGAALFTQDSVS